MDPSLGRLPAGEQKVDEVADVVHVDTVGAVHVPTPLRDLACRVEEVDEVEDVRDVDEAVPVRVADRLHLEGAEVAGRADLPRHPALVGRQGCAILVVAAEGIWPGGRAAGVYRDAAGE